MTTIATVPGRTVTRHPRARTAILLSLLRIPLLVVAFTTVTLILLAVGAADTWADGWQRASDHAYVVLNFAVDVPCLLILSRVLRRDGRRLRDLLGPSGLSWRRLLGRGLAVFAVMAVMFALIPVVAQLVTGAAPYPAGITHPPLWVAIWTVVVFPLVTAPTEELLFRGYALPELHAAAEASTTRRARLTTIGVAIAVTAAGFGVAHTLIPPEGGSASLIARAITLTAIGVVLDVIRLRTRHLVPLIIGHYLIDAILIGGFALLAATR